MQNDTIYLTIALDDRNPLYPVGPYPDFSNLTCEQFISLYNPTIQEKEWQEKDFKRQLNTLKKKRKKTEYPRLSDNLNNLVNKYKEVLIGIDPDTFGVLKEPKFLSGLSIDVVAPKPVSEAVGPPPPSSSSSSTAGGGMKETDIKKKKTRSRKKSGSKKMSGNRKKSWSRKKSTNRNHLNDTQTGGGDFLDKLQVLGLLLLYIVFQRYIAIPVQPEEPEQALVEREQILSHDRRRVVMLIDLKTIGEDYPEACTSIVLKMTDHRYFIKRYKREAQVYKILQGKGASQILRFYHCGVINEGKAEIEIKTDSGSGSRSISFVYQHYDVTRNWYYLALEYNPDYVTLCSIKDRKIQNKCFSQICNSIFTLNRRLDFVHGDLKSDNVMVDIKTLNKDVREIQVINFDFDYSHFIGSQSTETLAEEIFKEDRSSLFVKKLGTSYLKPFLPDPIDVSPHETIYTKEFFYFFDIWRLYCSIYSLFNRSDFYDEHLEPIVKYPFKIPLTDEGKKTITIRDLIGFDLKLQDQLRDYVLNQVYILKAKKKITFTDDGNIIEFNILLNYNRINYRELQLFNRFYIHPKIIIGLMIHLDIPNLQSILEIL